MTKIKDKMFWVANTIRKKTNDSSNLRAISYNSFGPNQHLSFSELTESYLTCTRDGLEHISPSLDMHCKGTETKEKNEERRTE